MVSARFLMDVVPHEWHQGSQTIGFECLVAHTLSTFTFPAHLSCHDRRVGIEKCHSTLSAGMIHPQKFQAVSKPRVCSRWPPQTRHQTLGRDSQGLLRGRNLGPPRLSFQAITSRDRCSLTGGQCRSTPIGGRFGSTWTTSQASGLASSRCSLR